MSAADSKELPRPQPPLSQLWPNFGCTTSNVNIFDDVNLSGKVRNNFDVDHSFTSIHDEASNYGQFSHLGKRSKNENYVNFNQFIQQHNLMQSNGTAAIAPTTVDDFLHANNVNCYEAIQNPNFMDANADTNVNVNALRQTISYNKSGSIHNKNNDNTHCEIYNAGAGDSYSQRTNRFYPIANKRAIGDNGPDDANDQFPFDYNPFNTQNFTPNKGNLFTNDLIQSNGDGTVQSRANPILNHCNVNYQFENNFYKPFSANGTTYYANPFATGFDFITKASTTIPTPTMSPITASTLGLEAVTSTTTTTTTATKLQVTAPEFVPRFEQLTINETVAATSTTTAITTTTTSDYDNNKPKDKDDYATKFKNAIQVDNNNQIHSYGRNNVHTSNNQQFIKKESSHFRNVYNQQNVLDNASHSSNRNGTENSNGNNNTVFNSHVHYGKKFSNRLEKNMERFSRNFVDNKTFNDSSSNSNSSSPSTMAVAAAAGINNGNALNQISIKQNSIEFKQSENHRDECNSNRHTLQGNNGGSRITFNLGGGGDGSDGNGGGVGTDFNNHPDYIREERYDRYLERGEIRERANFNGGCRYNRDRDRERDYHQRYDNYRSNKRRDDWNRNRDRVIGYRVEEKYSTDNGSRDSPLHSPEKKLLHNGNGNGNGHSNGYCSPKRPYAENEKLSQREKLIRDIQMRRLECLVCVETIKSHQYVWSCHNCYHILHLQCIIKWASSSKSEDGWRCPACQNVEKDVPRDYYCFCGKLKNPPYSRQDLAHSCGEVCGRIEDCTHTCTLLCHPGPCPPCQANVKRTCGCGKTSKMTLCCLKETISCEAICEKLLNCEIHKCDEKCHLGKCPPCKETVSQKCHCSKQERQVACTRDSHNKHVYSCSKPCGKELSCGNHKCKDCCHANECRPCKLSPEIVTSCPCGKKALVPGQRKSCLDAIPVCDSTCGKTLRCGKPTHPHHCTSKCHLGPCPPCNKQTAVKCRCGHMDQMIKCRQLSTRADDARCKKRCIKKRSCGKHKCNQECCIDIDHICPLPCTHTLSCGKHKCDQPCHRGNCPPCYRSSFEELFCECGAEVIYPPVPCGTKRPLCKRPCSRKHPCGHPPHHNCHSAANCPPCMILTTQWCYGHHQQRKTVPCSQQSFSCGLACNKPLPCGRHKCIRSCHEGPCQIAGAEVCKQSCTTMRNSCGHKCMAPCHEGDCPDTQCKEMVEVQCQCGNRKQMRPCHELAREYSRIATAQLASSMAEMQRGNYMELSEILAPIKLTNKTNKTLDCNDECRTLERNRRLAIGLQVRNTDVPQKVMTKYSEYIRNFAKRDPTLVKSVHEALTTLVKLAKESKQKSRSHSFPIMNRDKRQLVHEMCEVFGVDSVAYDAEPNRNVVATAYKDRSWLPPTSIMEVLQREAGQRRIPVPTNNAWGSKR